MGKFEEVYAINVNDKTEKKGNNTILQPKMTEINKTIMRCLTKNLAMFGLGLYIYAGEDLPYTVAGRATGTSQIIGMALVETTTENSVLTVRNPAGTAVALTITPLAGGVRPVSAHLVIMQIQ